MRNSSDLNSDQCDTAISGKDKRERARLAALERLDAVRPEADSILQEIVDDVCETFGTDLCMINLVTADAQYFRAWSGDLAEDLAEARQNSREHSMCRYVVDAETPLIVEDFLATEEFREQHFCVHYGLRFYAGTPLLTSDGHAIGTLCVLSARAGKFGEEQMKVLKTFARAVVSRLELLGVLSHERADRQQMVKQSEELRRQRDKQAVEMQSRLAAVVESSDDAIISTTLDGIITSWNSSAERLYGYSAEEVVGRSISVLVPADLSGEVPEILRRARGKAPTAHYEAMRIRKDGSRVDVSITVSPIIYPAGDIVGASIIAHDINERKQLEAIKDSFISTVSHELRTPLTSIRGYLEALMEDEGGPLNDEQREYADIAYRNTGRLQKIVEDLLLLPRLDSELELNSEVLNVGEVLHQVKQEFSPVVQEKNIALAIEAESDLVIMGDRFRIAQAMSNLVGNALKFTPPERRVSIFASRWHDEVIVEVIDEGVGIPAAELPRLTERFFRASTATSTHGTGLGLAITKGIIERHGGKLEIESEEGVGSTFRLVLPVASQG